METYTFYKEDFGGWYIDLPAYLEQGGSKGDLAMVAGADTMLDIIAGDKKQVTIDLDIKPFDGSDLLELTKVCDPSTGGGYYLMRRFEGRTLNQEMWLCAVTEFVFGYLPERIYVRRVKKVDR